MIQFSATSYSVNENAGSVTFTVIRSGNTSVTSSFHFATANGSATSPGDYNAAAGTLTFAPGETAKSFNIAIIDDNAKESTETFNIVLSNASNATLGTPAVATVSILDNDRNSRPPRTAPSSKQRQVFRLGTKSLRPVSKQSTLDP